MAARCNRPLVDDDLIGANSRSTPSGFGRAGLHRLNIKVEHSFIGGHRIFHAHHKLHIESAKQLAVLVHCEGLKDMREVERLYLRGDFMGLHFRREPCDQIRWVLINSCWEIVRSDRKRSHVGAEGQHSSPLLACARATARRELDDHAGTVFFDAFFQARKLFWIGRGRFIVVANMRVADRSPGFKSFVCGFYLLLNRDGHRRIGGFGRNRSGYRDAEDAGVT